MRERVRRGVADLAGDLRDGEDRAAKEQSGELEAPAIAVVAPVPGVVLVARVEVLDEALQLARRSSHNAS